MSFEDLSLTASDGVKINGWYVPAPDARTTLLLFHGNGGNMSHRIELLRRLHRIDVNVFMIDYRGYGKSEGKISEEGTYRDALAAYDSLLTRADVDPSRIVVFGQSLGAGVAVELATRRKLAGLILEAPFASIREMAKVVVPWLPIGRLISTRYDNLAKIKKIQIPLLILHGDRDEVVPYAQGRRIFEAANEPKRFYTIVGAGHNNTYRVGGEGYDEAIKGFIEEVQKL